MSKREKVGQKISLLYPVLKRDLLGPKIVLDYRDSRVASTSTTHVTRSGQYTYKYTHTIYAFHLPYKLTQIPSHKHRQRTCRIELSNVSMQVSRNILKTDTDNGYAKPRETKRQFRQNPINGSQHNNGLICVNKQALVLFGK